MQPPQHLSSNSNSQSNPDLERPATTFLSYAREDTEEVIYLQQQLNVRGVRAWRDVTDLWKLKEIAKRILVATLTLRLRRAGADRSYEPCLCFHTYRYDPPTDSLDLDVDWTWFFPTRDVLPTEKVWDEILLPALADVKQALSMKTPSRKLHIFVQAHLPVAFALGAAFPESAHLTLQVNARAEGQDDIWSTGGSTSIVEPFEAFSYQAEGDAHVAVIEIAIPTSTAADVARNLDALGISYKHHIRLSVRGGPDNRAVKSSAQALAMSLQVGKELRRLSGQGGVTHIHLFAAVPAALAVMIGHQINSMSAITLYHFMEKDRRYVPVCTLGKQKATS